MRKVTVVVVAKAPRPGRVKTRLCPPCTLEDAARIAGAALADTLAALATVPAAGHHLVLDGRPGPWVPASFTVVAQGHGDLAARLAAALEGVGGAVLLVGMDTPQLSRALIERALDRLEEPDTDAVLGLATDGGWWALGLEHARSDVFAGVPTSRATTGARQLHRLHDLGLRTALLEELRDVDHFDDAVAVAAEVPGSRFAFSVSGVCAALAGGRA